MSLLVAVIEAVALLGGPVATEPGVTRANYERIREGMTLEETRAILGEPSGFLHGRDNGGTIVVWQGPKGPAAEEVVIYIGMSEEWRVTAKPEWPNPPEPLLDRLRRLLPW
jgi:hypothetical protein